MLHSNRMQSDGFCLTPPDGDAPESASRDRAWPSALLFESPAQIYQRVYRLMKPRSIPPEVEVRFVEFANADSLIQAREGKLLVRITDLLKGAPSPVMESLAFILLGKLLRKKIPAIYAHRYRLYLNRREMRKRAQYNRQIRGRKLYLAPQGRVHDLVQVFERLNALYFNGLMSRPGLGWSLRKSRTRLGHFDPSHNMIVVSQIFDQTHVPLLALEYVMFHEMLHLQFPVDHSGARRCVHTADFKRAEKRFLSLSEARLHLKNSLGSW